MQAEFDLLILSIFAWTSALVILGFSIYRFATGDIPAGVMDLAICLGLISITWYAWTWNARHAGIAFMVVVVTACIVSAVVLGRTATYWAFLVLGISFVVAGMRVALIANVILIAGLAVQPLFASTAELVIFLVCAFLVTGYGWLYNAQYRAQQHHLRRRANEDALTRAGNRRALFKRLRIIGASRRLSKAPCALAALDLDKFKGINDTAGHEAGDHALIRLAALIREHITADDGLFRLGGDEFVVVLVGASAAAPEAKLNTIREAFAAGASKDCPPTTISVGIATRLQGEADTDWLRRADKALYAAKAAGRDQVVTAN